jgi:hypothetical protein
VRRREGNRKLRNGAQLLSDRATIAVMALLCGALYSHFSPTKNTEFLNFAHSLFVILSTH